MFESTRQIGSRRLAVLIDGDNAQPSLIEKNAIGIQQIRHNHRAP